MLRIVSANLNGIRSADKKGFFTWMAQSGADVVCVQELKAQLPDLAPHMQAPDGYHGFFHPAEKKGYSGVGLYCRRAPDRVVEGLGIADIDAEGRYLRADFGNVSVVSLYLPSGSSSEERQLVKFAFMKRFLPILEALHAEGREMVLCGDWNIAHREIDLKNWKGNVKNSGFLPEERAWIGDLFQRVGWVDTWRTLYPEAPGYTWWSNRGQAYAKDVGWRIDYQLATPGIAAGAVRAAVYKEEKFSDHAPLIVDYDHPDWR
ncbi:MAG: exodeoxyribonuclease III [Paludibacterium sp.]|uniref:exodeoxyribonuclease III n=1 Tax=Paludibacterium sp. TaxID=1917523 RepID=UPI002600E2E3|nr:exodeoxyribonuclease III [Paludibacterium sp.]MBV8045840.1 exodeoxyribonuclease III [Paludibacterium sp.]MBV8648560.1 exodeoxyribonuclease III [Paludibacterium sp.]